MPRGGRRQGVPGANYGNRSDLAMGPRKLPISVAPGQQYGQATAQTQAQQAVPMASAPLQAPDVHQAARDFQPPPVIGMAEPSMNPAEPVTSGMGVGPSAPPLQASPVLKGVAVLNALGDGASPEVKAIRDVLTAIQGNEAAP